MALLPCDAVKNLGVEVCFNLGYDDSLDYLLRKFEMIIDMYMLYMHPLIVLLLQQVV
jgi:hypothetical protein